jgi:ribosomal protein L7/L12
LRELVAMLKQYRDLTGAGLAEARAIIDAIWK